MRRNLRLDKDGKGYSRSPVTHINGKALYKVFFGPAPEMRSPFGRPLKWSLPRGTVPGKWMRRKRLELCQSGLHVCVGAAGVQHVFEDRYRWHFVRLFCVQIKGHAIGDGEHYRHTHNKVVCNEVRLVEEITKGSAEWKHVWGRIG